MTEKPALDPLHCELTRMANKAIGCRSLARGRLQEALKAAPPAPVEIMRDYLHAEAAAAPWMQVQSLVALGKTRTEATRLVFRKARAQLINTSGRGAFGIAAEQEHAEREGLRTFVQDVAPLIGEKI